MSNMLNINLWRFLFLICMSLLTVAAGEKVDRESEIALTVDEEVVVSDDRNKQTENLFRLQTLQLGMSVDQVTTIMGEHVVIGFDLIDVEANPKPITIVNPYQEQLLKGNEKKFLVKYYFTHVLKADELISQDELTPLTFEEGVLVARDWSELSNLIEQYNLK